MNHRQVLETLKLVREYSQKRNFTQAVDLIINLSGLNLKKSEENINNFVVLPYKRSKESKLGIFVGDELISQAKGNFDLIIHKDDFKEYAQDPNKIRKIAKHISFFIAQVNLMPDIAKYFGKILGSMGKMPNPKSGAVVPALIPDIKPLVSKLRSTLRIQTKNELSVKVSVGTEAMKDEELAENIFAVYQNVFYALHEDKHKIKNVILKFSMGRPFFVGKEYTPEELKNKDIEEKKKGKLEEQKEEKSLKSKGEKE